MKKIGTLAVIITLVLIACTDAKMAARTAPKDSLSGVWELDYITPTSGADAKTSFPNKKPTIIFNEEKMSAGGTTGCNNYGGSYELKDHSLRIKNVFSTKMFCEGVNEHAFTSELEKVTGYSVSGKQLTLLMGDIATMRFVKK